MKGMEEQEQLRLPVKFCPFCGKAGPDIRNGKEIRCKHCDGLLYVNTAAAVGVILEKDGLVLVTVRAINPGKGLYDFPGGFLDSGETLEEAAIREIREELSVIPSGLHYLCSYPNDYKYKNVNYSVCDAFFVATGYLGAVKADPGEIQSLEWIAPDQIDESRFAFSSHARALRQFLSRRKNS